jgi:putative acetyltransferase
MGFIIERIGITDPKFYFLPRKSRISAESKIFYPQSITITIMPVIISAERPDSPDARALIAELDAYLVPLYPPASHHGYPVEKLLAEAVEFFVARADGAAAGCGAMKIFDSGYAEIKRMYVRPAFRGTGLGRRMIDHLEAHAARRGISILRLETGILQKDAIGLYEAAGYRRIEPFGEYRPDPLSFFYEKRLPRPLRTPSAAE